MVIYNAMSSLASSSVSIYMYIFSFSFGDFSMIIEIFQCFGYIGKVCKERRNKKTKGNCSVLVGTIMPAGDELFLHLQWKLTIFGYDDFPVLGTYLTHELYGLLHDIVHYACKFMTNSFKIYSFYLLLKWLIAIVYMHVKHGMFLWVSCSKAYSYYSKHLT